MFWKYTVSWMMVFVTFLVLAGTGYAAPPIKADFSQVNGICLESTPSQYRINNISVQYTDATGQLVNGLFDVIFKWDPERYVLVPVALAGMQNGHLRVQVSDSVTGSPVQGVKVSVLDRDVLTDDDGIARFGGLPDQKVGVCVSHTGYENLAVDVNIPSDGSTKKLAVQILPMLSTQ